MSRSSLRRRALVAVGHGSRAARSPGEGDDSRESEPAWPRPEPRTPAPPPYPSPPASAGGTAPAAPPLPPPPVSAVTPSGASANPQLRLFVSGGLVVLIVIVIVALTWARRGDVLRHVPEGSLWVDVTHMARFIRSPMYEKLDSADHPISLHLHAFAENHDVRLKDDIQAVADTQGATLLVGHFLQRRMRQAFEVRVEFEARRLGPAGEGLTVQEDEVEGQPYLYAEKVAEKGAVDLALGWHGSGMVCSGDRASVRRFLARAAGRRNSVLDDENFASVYQRGAARRALFYRLEKPDGDILAGPLKSVMLDAGDGLRAAFYALSCTEEQVELGVWLRSRNDETAALLHKRLLTPEAKEALGALIGSGDDLTVELAGPMVVLTAKVAMARFEELVELDKEALKTGQPRNLIHLLLD